MHAEQTYKGETWWGGYLIVDFTLKQYVPLELLHESSHANVSCFELHVEGIFILSFLSKSTSLKKVQSGEMGNIYSVILLFLGYIFYEFSSFFKEI